MKKHFVLIALCVLLFSVGITMAQPKHDSVNNQTISVKDSLEIQKIQLEVAELQNKQKRSWINLLISVLGGLTGAVAIGWTIINGVKSYRTQLEQQKLKTISDLLVSLTDESPNKRVGAANGLGKYADLVVDELVTSIANEEEGYILEAIEKALLNVDPQNHDKIIQYNRFANNELIKLLGELSITSVSQADIDIALRLDQDLRVSMIRNNRYLYDYGKTIGKRNENILVNEITDTFTAKAKRLQRIISSTGRVIAKIINQEQRELTNVNVSYTELYRKKVANANFAGFYALNTLCRHIEFDGCTFENAIFKGADMFDSKFENTKLSKCNFSGTNLRQSKGKGLQLNHCDFTNQAILSESTFDDLVAHDTDFNKCKMNNFKVSSSKFDETKFNASKLNHCVFTDTTLNNCDFFGSIIIEGTFQGTTLSHVKFNGADLRGAKFINAHLAGVDFSGADLKNIVLENCEIIDCLFDKAKNYDP